MFHPSRLVFFAVSALVAAGASSCSKVECAAGTKLVGSACAPVIVSCGANAALVGDSCVVTGTVCAAGTVFSEADHTCVAEAAAFDAAATPWSANARVSASGKWAAEPSMAVDSTGRLFVAAMLSDRGGNGDTVATLWRSTDGIAFDVVSAQKTLRGGFTGDVTVAVDADDAVYFGYVDYGPSDGMSYPDGDIWVQVSRDHGDHLAAPVKVNEDDGHAFSDRPWLVAAANGELLLSFTHDIGKVDGLPLYHSTDHGTTWTALGDIAGALTGQQIYTQGQFPTARTAASYLLPRLTYDQPSRDEPSFFLDLYRTSDFRQYSVTRLDRIYGSRDLSVDASAVPAVGPGGAVYLAYMNASSRNIDVMVARSGDGGDSFDAPVSVHPLAGAATQAMPWLAVDPKSGDLHLIFIDNHTGEWMLVGARSSDGGRTFSMARVSDKTYVEDARQTKWLGDFNAVSVNNGKVCAVWTDTRGGESAVYAACRASAGAP